MRLPPCGVCRLFLGGFFGQKPANLKFCVVREQDDVSELFSHSSLVLLFCEAFAKVSQIPYYFRLCFLLILRCQLRSFCLESRKPRSLRTEAPHGMASMRVSHAWASPVRRNKQQGFQGFRYLVFKNPENPNSIKHALKSKTRSP